MMHKPQQASADDWVSFPGGELEGRRPKALCPACREALKRAASSGRTLDIPAPGTKHVRALCFQCYRAELDRQKAIGAAGRLDTASEQRFQVQLPFDPVNRPRLEMLRADREAARAASRAAITGPYVDRRRQAQIAARHALQQIAAGFKARQFAKAERDRAMAAAFHAAELQLPDSWIPFVMSR